jgi:hypothetical protein
MLDSPVWQSSKMTSSGLAAKTLLGCRQQKASGEMLRLSLLLSQEMWDHCFSVPSLHAVRFKFRFKHKSKIQNQKRIGNDCYIPKHATSSEGEVSIQVAAPRIITIHRYPPISIAK